MHGRRAAVGPGQPRRASRRDRPRSQALQVLGQVVGRVAAGRVARRVVALLVLLELLEGGREGVLRRRCPASPRSRDSRPSPGGPRRAARPARDCRSGSAAGRAWCASCRASAGAARTWSGAGSSCRSRSGWSRRCQAAARPEAVVDDSRDQGPLAASCASRSTIEAIVTRRRRQVLALGRREGSTVEKFWSKASSCFVTRSVDESRVATRRWQERGSPRGCPAAGAPQCAGPRRALEDSRRAGESPPHRRPCGTIGRPRRGLSPSGIVTLVSTSLPGPFV